jgi:hypothetical protein
MVSRRRISALTTGKAYRLKITSTGKKAVRLGGA